MDRVVFLIEATGERVSCLLNPESLTFTRQAGLRTRTSRGGALLAAASADDPLIVTGGGRTELELQLLFDTDLARSLDPGTILTRNSWPQSAEWLTAEPGTEPQPGTGTSPPQVVVATEPDVRDLTRPLWALAEPFDQTGSGADAPLVRFIWGRAWNMPAVITAAAERLEIFGPGGTPRRSWLTLRLRRVADHIAPDTPFLSSSWTDSLPNLLSSPLDSGANYVQAIADIDGNIVTPLYQLASEHLGTPEAWPLIAAASGIEDPLHIASGTVLTIPSIVGAP